MLSAVIRGRGAVSGPVLARLLATHARACPKLNELHDNPGASRRSKPKGRGPGTGKGKTATRGHKGRRARAGGSVRIGFEGGQTPLYLRLPKYGFKRTKLQQPLEVMTLFKLQLMIDQGRLDVSKTITIPDLVACGALRRVSHGVKLLASGSEHFTAKVAIEVTQTSAGAIEAVEKNGGKIRSVYYGQTYLRHLLGTRSKGVDPRRPSPKNPRPPLKRIGYWLDWNNRGYLSTEAQLEDAGIHHGAAAASARASVGVEGEGEGVARPGAHPEAEAEAEVEAERV